jgi:hypothetical protein
MTTTDFYFTGGAFNTANPKDPKKNFRLQVSIPDPSSATAGTQTFAATAGFGDPARNIAYTIDTTKTGSPVGSGTATLTMDTNGATLAFSGQAARAGESGSTAQIDGAVRCTTVLHPRG